jgi:hypothetical protein
MKVAERYFKHGMIAQSMFDKQKTALKARQATWQNAELTLMLELTDYRAIISGLS